MKGLISLLALILLALSVSCSPPAETQPPQDTASDEEALRSLIARAAESFSAKDLDALMALYSSDVVQMPPNQPTLEGKQTLRDSFQSFLEQNSGPLKATVQDVRVSGDWAYIRASYEQSITPTGGGETVDEVGKWVLICQREAGGDWKVVSEIWNLDRPRGENQETSGA